VKLPSLALIAGGLATRLGRLAMDTPKSLIDVAGHPFIDHQLHWLARQGIEDVVVCAGHLGEKIQEFVGDGSAYGLRICFSLDGPKLIGTGGALKKALPLLSDPFFALYGDSYLDLPFELVAEAFASSGKAGLMTVYPNDGKYESSNVEFRDGTIVAYDKKYLKPEMRHIDYGLELFSKKPFQQKETESFDLVEIQTMLVHQGQLAAFEVKNRFYEIGSERGLAETREYFNSNPADASSH
jgi:N-acetyl-alpha-D-muramate 1-phosphate uridylyltransferase